MRRSLKKRVAPPAACSQNAFGGTEQGGKHIAVPMKCASPLHRYCTGTSQVLHRSAQVRAGHTRSVGLVKLGRLGRIGGSVGVRMLEGDVWGMRRVQDVKDVEVMGGLLWALLCGLHNEL